MKTPPDDLAERLWAVADQALQQSGELRVEQLAEMAGIPRATIYYYFSGKDDVVAFLLAQVLQRGTEAIAEALERPGGAAQRLDAVVRAMLHTMAEHPALCTRLMGEMSNQANGPLLMAGVEQALMAPVRELLETASATGELTVADATDTTLSIMGAVSTIAMVRTGTGTFDPDEVADRLVPQLLDGLRAPH